MTYKNKILGTKSAKTTSVVMTIFFIINGKFLFNGCSVNGFLAFDYF